MKLKFKLISGSGGVMDVDQIMQKPCGLVAVGKITSGGLSKGEMISIQNADKMPIYDGLKRIEKNHEEVRGAIQGELVGVCLGQTSKSALIDYLINKSQ
ncbi:MAG: hypothetical protein WC467_04395 [Patescibacteria group bacterium]